MQKFGFVYLWYDRKHKKFYLGCHWGTEDDGYICSSTWMRNAYNRRPSDFKRRIISRVHSSRDDLLKEEMRWLSFIKTSELKSRYYNIKNHKLTEELIANTTRTRKRTYLWHSEETKRKMSEAAKGRTQTNLAKQKLREANLGKSYSKEVNIKKGRKKRYLLSTPDGLEVCVYGLDVFCKERGMSLTNFLTKKSSRGWSILSHI